MVFHFTTDGDVNTVREEDCAGSSARSLSVPSSRCGGLFPGTCRTRGAGTS